MECSSTISKKRLGKFTYVIYIKLLYFSCSLKPYLVGIFICSIMLPADLKNWDLQQKKKNSFGDKLARNAYLGHTFA